uniref:Uncharacterized protein n=1 Tax=Caenorhabditis japonica TaxID=281687 RepID=A0A8R1E954_CAEJA
MMPAESIHSVCPVWRNACPASFYLTTGDQFAPPCAFDTDTQRSSVTNAMMFLCFRVVVQNTTRKDLSYTL